MPQGRRDQHRVAGEFTGHDLARVAESGQIGEHFPNPLRPDPEGQHAADAALIEHRAGDEGEGRDRLAVGLKPGQVRLEKRSRPIEAGREFGRGQHAARQGRAAGDRIAQREDDAAAGVDEQQVGVVEGLGDVQKVVAKGIVRWPGGVGGVTGGEFANRAYERRPAGEGGAVADTFRGVGLQLMGLARRDLDKIVLNRLLERRCGDPGRDRGEDRARDQRDHQEPEQETAGDRPPQAAVAVG